VTATKNTTLTRTEQNALVQRVIQQVDGAFDELYARYDLRLRRAVLHIVSVDDIDDVVQASWILILRNLASWQGTAELSTWLHRVAVNCALGFLRKQKNDRRTISLDAGFSDTPGDDTFLLEPSFEERAYQTVGDMDKMRAAIEDLPDMQRVILLMAHEGVPYQEVADVLGIPISSVKSHLHRLPERLRTAMRVVVPVLHKAKLRKRTSSAKKEDFCDA
jgi:RNA polymerase sigma-70 factor (ECF subfamily)